MMNLFIFRLMIVLIIMLPCRASFAETKGIVLGATLPLTGNLATYGERIRQGISVAIEDLKQEGISVTLVSEDTPMSGPTVTSILQKLVGVDRVQGIAGNFSNVAMLNMATTLKKSKIVAMHTAAMDDEIIAASDGWIFSVNTRVRDEAKMLAEYAYNTGSRKAAIITIETNFGQGYRQHFKENFERLGGKVIADETYQLGDIDYRSQLTKIRTAKPDIMFASTFGHFLGLTLRQARQLGISTRVLSVYESEDPSVVEAAGSSGNGLQYFVSYNPVVEGNAVAVRQRLHDRLAMVPSTFTLNAYDATILISRAIADCKGVSECVRAKLFQTRNYQGVGGLISIGTDGAADRTFYLREIKDGKFVSVKQ